MLSVLQGADSRLTLLRAKAVLRPGVVADALDAPAIIKGIGQIGLRIRIERVVLPAGLHLREQLLRGTRADARDMGKAPMLAPHVETIVHQAKGDSTLELRGTFILYV